MIVNPPLCINVFEEVKVVDVVYVEVKIPYEPTTEYFVESNFFPTSLDVAVCSATLTWPPSMARAPSKVHYSFNASTATYSA